ncbi:uncharacterized protein LOC133818185, partial [Humulus lupulus]|uniref:uncharacterized protein LOC133818185 n=1 Tax=Humulus lupulus TaxID=3486 RepID=UPI002B405F6B
TATLHYDSQQVAERGGYGGERYEQLEFQKKARQCYKALHDASWKQAKWGTTEQIDRPILWKEARKDSSGNYVTEHDKVMGEAIEDMLEQIKEGKLIEIGTNDILTQVLGNAEHLGQVRGQSRGVTQRDYFHKPIWNILSSIDFVCPLILSELYCNYTGNYE